MLFSSAIFLFLFLPIVLFVYYLVGEKLKNLVLLIASLFFYTWGEQLMVLLILASTLVDFIAGILIKYRWKKVGLGMSLFFNLGILFYYKYANFTFENIVSMSDYFGFNASFFTSIASVTLPLGISFFTFQTLSYTIDVYNEKVKANTNFINFATYVTLFPKLVAGPIVRYSDIESELKYRTFSIDQFSEGVKRFIIGLGKKMIIANNLAFVADGAFEVPIDQVSFSFAWIGIFAYAFQIYFDFAGYSDMAIGLGKMFGFNFPENFNFPYISKSIKEFWRRWHISLSTWFRDYLYIPLGGNKLGNKRTYINLIIVFLITGLWHGAKWNFVVWGLWHGLFLMLERSNKIHFKTPELIKHIYMLFVVLIGWVFFRANNLTLACDYLHQMFFQLPRFSEDSFLSFYLRKESIIAFVFALFSLFPLQKIVKNQSENLNRLAFQWVEKLLLLIVFIISILYIAVNAYNPFIYYRF